ncbi:MAG: hypothetical protein HYS08_03055 [Chlamydiae bacterium]|nr:hypothetical protein [Chlamydiota bacterium]
MKTVLIVSPHFPPINAPDMQRVRMSLPYLEEFGWKPIILSVDPDQVEGPKDPLLIETLPSELKILRVKAFKPSRTRIIGVGNVGLRAWPWLYQIGSEVIQKSKVDLVFFSTSVFLSLPLGRVWKQKWNTPYAVDMQDPWWNPYRPPVYLRFQPKHMVMRNMHRILERWTMKHVSGIMSVSEGYIQVLKNRYKWLSRVPSKVLTFGASEVDFDVLKRFPQKNRFFTSGDGFLHGVYVGRGGYDMKYALNIIFKAFHKGLQENPSLFSKVKLHFIGTDYAPEKKAQKTIEPIAKLFGVAPYVLEQPQRIPFYESLQLLSDADFLIVPGSEDPQYTASKIYPYILARKPLLSLFQESSSVIGILKATKGGRVLPFNLKNSVEIYATEFKKMWEDALGSLSNPSEIDLTAFKPYMAREMAREQCNFFNSIFKVHN